MAEDPEAAAAEWNGIFRSDLESYVSLDVLDACTDPGVTERPPETGIHYVGFIDAASGTGRDSFCAAVAHRSADGIAVLDAVLEVKPPFDAAAVVREVAEWLRRYGITAAQSDAYAAGLASSMCAEAGLVLRQDAPSRSELYLGVLPLLTSRRVLLLDDDRLRRQLTQLERRRRAGERDLVDHGPAQHDDRCNAAVGALLRAAEAPGLGVSVSRQAGRVVLGTWCPAIDRATMPR
jgi:hypothetical protein